MVKQERQREFIEERVKLHQDAEADFLINGILPPCSDEERWKKNDTFRVMKKGRKSAVRVLSSQEEADEFMDGHKDKKLLQVEMAEGQSVRCESYCSVSQFCNQYQEEKSDDGSK